VYPRALASPRARGHAYDLHRGTQAQADAYLVKPFKPAELAAEVARLLAD